MVTVWGVSAVASALNVSVVGLTVPSVVSLLERWITTGKAGTVFSFTVKVAVPPASVVVKPLVGVTVMPGATAVWQAENSDVLPLGSVAVAVMTLPTVAAASPTALKLALPLPFVVVWIVPRYSCPSP